MSALAVLKVRGRRRTRGRAGRVRACDVGSGAAWPAGPACARRAASCRSRAGGATPGPRACPERVVAWACAPRSRARSAARWAARSLPRQRPAAGRGRGALVRAAAARADLVVASSHAIAWDLDPDSRLVRQSRSSILASTSASSRDRGRPAEPPEVVVLARRWLEATGPGAEAIVITRRTRPEVRLWLVGAPLDSAGEEGLLERCVRARRGRPRGRG